MDKFENIKLNFGTIDYYFYSTKFKDTVVKKLKKFSQQLVDVASSKYSDTQVPIFFKQLDLTIDALNKTYMDLKAEEKKFFNEYSKIIELRENYADKIYSNLQSIINMLSFAAAGDSTGLNMYTGGLQINEEVCTLLKNDKDYCDSVDRWVNSFLDLINNNIYSKLTTPTFPKYKLNKKIFEKNNIWKNVCKNELLSVFNQLKSNVKNINGNEHEELKKSLYENIDAVLKNVSEIYKTYEPEKRGILTKIFNKTEYNKVKIARFKLMDSLSKELKEFKTFLVKNGYKGHPFDQFLNYLIKKIKIKQFTYK